MPSIIRYSQCVFLFICYCFVVFVAAAEKTDLYKLLGVARTATTQEIKKAYRKKALDTHPDKNKDVPAEEAAAAFHKVVQAFEILSDESSRKRYDRTGRTDDPGMGGGGRQQQQQQWTFRWNTQQRRAKPKLKDRSDVKQAQARILHIVSLDQLEVIITNGLVLERNLLICFYTPPHETHVMEEMVYPWPFAGMSSHGIWWEDFLQTTVVRFHRSNTLTEFFGVPKGDDLDKPLFLFGKVGQTFRDLDAWNRLSTDNRQIFDTWMWQQLQVDVQFVNEHDHTVELFWVRDRKAALKATIRPNEKAEITTMLSHEWWVRDARTDTRGDGYNRSRMAAGTCLYNVKVTSNSRTEYTIPKRECFDRSGHCSHWNRRGTECSRNPTFMYEHCASTCNRCEKEDPIDTGEKMKNNTDGETESSAKDEL